MDRQLLFDLWYAIVDLDKDFKSSIKNNIEIGKLRQQKDGIRSYQVIWGFSTFKALQQAWEYLHTFPEDYLGGVRVKLGVYDQQRNLFTLIESQTDGQDKTAPISNGLLSYFQ